MADNRYEVLRPVNNDIYNNKEPQMIQRRATNQAAIHLDTSVNKLQLDKTNMLLSTKSSESDSAGIIYQNVSRIKIYRAGIYFTSPNVNPRNNTVGFFSSVSGVIHTVTIPEGYYSVDSDLLDALIIALNSVTGLSGLTFSYIDFAPLRPSYFQLDSAGGNYRFDLNSDMLIKGEPLLNLPKSQNLENSKQVGSVFLSYTRYVDIVSSTLAQYGKLRTVSNGINSDILYRIYVGDVNIKGPSYVVDPVRESPTVINVLKNKPINQIDIQIKDEFGDFLYIPQTDPDTSGGFWLDITLIAEL
jgi:hypothetical protein